MKRLLLIIVALVLFAGCGGTADKGFYKDKNTDKPRPERPSPRK
jgi:hypothetical protein